jgi:amino acid adenylation domain-containing protein
MHELFAAQAEKTPDAIAVRYQDQSLTYEELNQRANQLAQYLQQQGVGPETLVGICAERTPDLLIGLLGILKAGGAYLPLDPTYPPERLAFMLADSQAPILLTQERLLPSLPQHSAKVVCLDRDWPTIQDCPPIANLKSIHVAPAGAKIPNPKSLAYVIYTSGSTGKPKGTLIEHRGLVNYLSWCLQAYPLSAGIGAPVHSSISFDMTITGLFSPLLAGQTVELLPEALGIEALATALRRGSTFSLVKITPAHLELLSHQLSAEEAAACTQAFIIGGENLRAEQLDFWRQFAPQTQLVNEYGPTETVVGCCVYTVASGDPRSGSVPIGRPIINTQLYILDGEQQPVPIGVVGELYIGGTGVARGYLNRPELTAERFINFRLPILDFRLEHENQANPKSTRLYKTGDLARYRADGVIEFLGRIDHQVKLRGYRIELGEIEAALSQCPGVRESFVLAREDQPGGQRLVAYLVPEGEPPDLIALRAALKRQLPEYMVPTGFVVLEALPLTVNGKVDRGALPAPEATNQRAAYAAPETGLEQAIADIWQRVLRLERVGRHDNFFDLGGHSLLAVQVHSQLQEALQRPIAMVDLFQYPTVHGLAQYLSQASPEPQRFQQVQEQVSRQKAAFQRRRQLSQQGGRHD